MKTANATMPSISGWHVLITVVVFFLIVMAVDGVMTYKAVSTFGGEAPDAYRVGLNYNQRIALERSQDARGWTDAVDYEASVGRLTATLKDRDGRGIDNLDLKATVGRPATDIADHEVKFVSAGGGKYWVSLPNLPEGTWAVDLTASESTGGRNVLYRSKVRLWKQP